MSGNSSHFDPSARLERLASVIDQLACPACLAALRLHGTQLLCIACGRVYPVIDGIPALIAEPEEQRTTGDADGA